MAPPRLFKEALTKRERDEMATAQGLMWVPQQLWREFMDWRATYV